jgi:hypothetical protein
MKIKFKTSVAGLNLHYTGGGVYDLSSNDATYWVREGLAEFVNEENEESEEIRPLVIQDVKKPRKRPVKK